MFEHFLRAQEPVYQAALAELEAGRKRTHWMWFIFPQLLGLGQSEMARRYALHSLPEARAFLAHPVLGARLGASTAAVLRHRGRSAGEIFGAPDDLKFFSSMTLFKAADPQSPLFGAALAAFYGGQEDAATLARL